jgi:hypothetical protein
MSSSARVRFLAAAALCFTRCVCGPEPSHTPSSPIVGEWEEFNEAGARFSMFFNSDGTCGEFFPVEPGCLPCRYDFRGESLDIHVLGGAHVMERHETYVVSISGDVMTTRMILDAAGIGVLPPVGRTRVRSHPATTCP